MNSMIDRAEIDKNSAFYGSEDKTISHETESVVLVQLNSHMRTVARAYESCCKNDFFLVFFKLFRLTVNEFK